VRLVARAEEVLRRAGRGSSIGSAFPGRCSARRPAALPSTFRSGARCEPDHRDVERACLLGFQPRREAAPPSITTWVGQVASSTPRRRLGSTTWRIDAKSSALDVVTQRR
jgi:hypothetical protein